MSDIFISYASEDRAWASRLAEALEAHGWSVWWDLRIAPGEQFDRVIEKELSSARCVIVIWSESSVSSKWVRAEAEDAMKRDVLIPVLIEDAQIPLVFRQIQAAKLQDWHEGLSHPALEQLIASVSSKLGSEPVKRPATEERAVKSPLRKWLKWTIPALLLACLPYPFSRFAAAVGGFIVTVQVFGTDRIRLVTVTVVVVVLLASVE